MNNNTWLQNFISNNAWSIFMGLLTLTAGYMFFYANTTGRINALEESQNQQNVAILGVTNNQTQILLLQQNDKNIREKLDDIQEDVDTLLDRSK